MVENMNVYEPEATFNDNDWKVFGGWVKGVLTVQPATITFTKKDGTERVMNCTLRGDMLPVVEIKEDKTPRKKNDTVLSVYDIDAQAWRSFTVNAVKRVEFVIDGE
jgi:hypothetical protein